MAAPQRYVAVLLFSLWVDGTRTLHREDIVLVHARDADAATADVEARGRAEESAAENGDGAAIVVRFEQVVDVAPLPADDLTTTADLYSRHFRDVDAYRRFDPMLAGEPL